MILTPLFLVERFKKKNWILIFKFLIYKYLYYIYYIYYIYYYYYYYYYYIEYILFLILI